jgi:glycosyltransferase involved in cell wall biosynthesis
MGLDCIFKFLNIKNLKGIKKDNRRKMNIGYEAKRIFHNRTGLGNYSRDIVRIMSEYYPDNQYFLYNPKVSFDKLFISNEKNVHEILPRKAFDKAFNNIWRQHGVRKEIIRDKIDLFHGLSGEIPIRLKNSKIPVLVTIHDLIFLRFPHFYSLFDRKIHKVKARHACQHANIVIAVSEQTKRDVIDFFNIPEEKVKVIYQGCQDIFKHTYPTEEIETLKKKMKLPKNYILNVGTIEERKNILTGVKAIKDIDTHLAIIGGETAYTQKVKDYIARENLESKVSFLKRVTNKELAMLYQGASLFIYPSLFEGFGIPIIEALYSKTPVVTSTGGCFGEAGGASSIYVDPSDHEQLAFEIKRVLNDNSLRQNMIEAGLKHAEKFCDKGIADNYIKLYKSVVP